MTPISESAPHIYLSALPFAPEHSLVAKKFSSKFPNTLTVTEGRPAQWPFTIFTAEYDKYYVKCLVFSPDEKTFACISPWFVTLKQDILFRAHFSLNTVHGFKLPVSALVELIFWSETMTVQSSGISREVRSSLQLRVEILFSFSVVVGTAALPHLIG